MAAEPSPSICKGGEPLILGGREGVVLPLVHVESQTAGAVLYLVALLWCFLGVSIIADIFMCAIEKITSAKKTVSVGVDGPQQTKTVKVWNKTVANLTLMALGSSAPEILLSVIELLAGNMHSGSLGPSTIVGSAAFNLLVIIAVCISALPAGESRAIQDLAVFGVTAVSSIFAYFWLIVILLWNTPHVVDVWEGVLTFLFFPLLVWVAYHADIGTFHSMVGAVRERRLIFSPSDTSKEDYDKMIGIIQKKYGTIPEEPSKLKSLLLYEFPEDVSRAARRIQAIREISAQPDTRPHHAFLLGGELSARMCSAKGKDGKKMLAVVPADEVDSSPNKGKSIVEFVSPSHAVSEATKTVAIKLRRTGNTSSLASVKFRTVDHTAKAGEDYEFMEGRLAFNPGVTERVIDIKIIDDSKLEGTEEFFVELLQPSADSGTLVGLNDITTVVVLDNDSSGALRFDSTHLAVPEPSKSTVVNIPVRRVNGASGAVSCRYKTEDGTAVGNKDFMQIPEEPKNPDANVLRMAEGQLEAMVSVEVLPVNSVDRREEAFRLILFDPKGGITFEGDVNSDGDELTLTITIVSDPDGLNRYQATMAAARAMSGVLNFDNIAVGRENWAAQFREALYPGGDDGDEEPSVADRIFHVFSLPWELLFATVPPVDFAGGWVCFFCALVMIGVCTAMIGDLANLLGCALDVKAPICAVTFVALGTSLPDTFASKTAAIQDPTADNSIGNVTGSNSVNVFLGLGFPWMIGALHWWNAGATQAWRDRGAEMDWPGEVLESAKYREDGAFVVPAGNLGASVAVFVCCAVSCIALLLVRRKLGAELGGDRLMALASSGLLVLLWFVYIGAAVAIEGGLGPYE